MSNKKKNEGWGWGEVFGAAAGIVGAAVYLTSGYTCEYCSVGGFTDDCKKYDNDLLNMPEDIANKHNSSCIRPSKRQEIKRRNLEAKLGGEN